MARILTMKTDYISLNCRYYHYYHYYLLALSDEDFVVFVSVVEFLRCHLLAECYRRRLNQGSCVLLYFVLFAFRSTPPS